MMNVRLATVPRPSSLTSRWPLFCFLSPCHFQPFYSFVSSPHKLLSSIDYSLRSLHVHPCTARRQIQSRAHTSLSLFNHWLCYRGYFPRQCLWRRWARQAEWEGEISLSLITWKPRYGHSHWLRWMNLIYLPFEAQMTSRYGSLSLYRRRSFLFFFAPPVKSGNAQEGMWRDFDRD